MRCESKPESDPIMPSDVYIWGSNSSHQVNNTSHVHHMNITCTSRVHTCTLLSCRIVNCGASELQHDANLEYYLTRDYYDRDKVVG